MGRRGMPGRPEAARGTRARLGGWIHGPIHGRIHGRIQGQRHRRFDAGMTTAEYAVGTLAAVAFAAVLLAVVRSGAVKGALTSIITTALSSAG